MLKTGYLDVSGQDPVSLQTKDRKGEKPPFVLNMSKIHTLQAVASTVMADLGLLPNQDDLNLSYTFISSSS